MISSSARCGRERSKQINLVVGYGAAGLAFADSLIEASRADIVMVDDSGEERVRQAFERFGANVRPGLEQLQRFCGERR